MKKRLLVLSVIACAMGGNVYSQQDKLLTHFMYDKMSVNPGATGLKRNAVCGTSIYRNQWDKVNGAPNSVVFNVDADLTQYNTFFGKVGISFYHDAIGFTRQNSAVFNYAYPLALPVGELQFGVGLGIMNLGMDPTWVPPTSTPDPTLPAAFGSTKFDANFGIYYRADLPSGNPFYVGLSSTHLPAPELEGVGQFGDPVGFNSARHYYMMGGYTHKNVIQGDDIDASFILRSDLVKATFEMNVRYMWQGAAYGGLTYRMSDAVGVMVGANPFAFGGSGGGPDFIIGYSYDMTLNKLSSISKGSHEILLKYCYPLPGIPITVSRHPRWL